MHIRQPGAVICALTLVVAAAAAGAQTPPPGRLLASNCFQCHGTSGRGPGFDQINGKSPGELYSKLKEYQAGKEGMDIMAKHSFGYTDAQLRQLDDWLSKQR